MKSNLSISILASFSLLYSAASTSETVISEDINIKVAPSLSLKSGDVYFQINGRVMADFAFWQDEAFSGVMDESGAGSELRRARIYLKGRYKDWQYRLQTDFAGNRTSNKSNYIKYTGFDKLDVYIGKHSEPFGLENLSSSKHISAIERSASTANFAGNREMGVSIAGKGENYGFHAGVFDIASTASDINLALTGRATYALLNKKSQVLHIGAAYSVRQLDESQSFAIKNRAGVHPTSIKSIVSGSIEAKSSNVYDLEVSYLRGNWHLSAEFINADIKGEVSINDRTYSNSYVQLGYFLTADQRKYNVASGTFGGIKPSSKDGAWEAFARIEDIDLSDADHGTEATIWTLGVNWFATQYTRLSLNYVASNIDYALLTNEGTEIDGQAISFRAQFHW